ncbi:MAG: CrcB family protein [Thiohalocapsa sp.]|uniref:fluoride efflux transporter FluC n=1 Tax=Thiohalocapsa sp. TaxID=2497641 RepID=UPI0025E036F3|nr:CrcB family protein [Thiohalocapsa sp.]MCG6943197.1 CrcB family protein [Thiohalocapsa sp.]
MAREPQAPPAPAPITPREMAPLLVLVFLGGALGSITRELLTPMLPELPPWVVVLLVNVSACFLVGWLYGAQDRLHHHLLQFAAVGFCGGFSTFSHFTDQVFNLASEGEMLAMTADVAGSVVLGVAAAYLGDLLGQHTGKAP